MMMVEAERGRVRLEEAGGRLRVVIPVCRHWAQAVVATVLVGMCVSVGVGFFTEYPAMLRAQLRQSGGTVGSVIRTVVPTGLGMLGGAGGCLIVICAWIQMALGREYWEVDAHGLNRWWGPIPLPRARRYLAEDMGGLRSVEATPDWWHEACDLRWWTGMSPSIAFDYGSGTVRLGSGLGEREGRRIVAAILERFPALGRDGSSG